MDDPDAPLVLRIGAGDARAAEALVARHLPRLTAVARRMLADPIEAEDVAQEVFLRVWREAPRWQTGKALFSTWMHRVAVNLCFDRLRRRRETLDPDAGLDVVDHGPAPHAGLIGRERAARVEAAVASLPERQRAAIVLCHYEEMSNIEAAAALEVSVEALESLLARGRRALRAALADLMKDGGDA